MENLLETHPPALSGPTDKIGPWTIKAIALDAKDEAIIAARREGLTTGQYLERLIRNPPQQVVNLSARSAELEQFARAMATLASAEIPLPRSVMRLWWRRMREALADPKPAPKALPPQSVSDGAGGSSS